MHTHEIQLLDNILDSLDRLYDNDNQVSDVLALLKSAQIALPQSDSSDIVCSTAARLDGVIKTGLLNEELRDAALTVTDDLRRHLSNRMGLGQ